MKATPFIFTGFLLAASGLIAARALETDQQERPAPRAQEDATAAQLRELAEAVRLATPVEQHRQLAQAAGTWENIYHRRWDPDGEWFTTEGTSTIEPMLGGRYTREESDFSVMDTEIQGVHLLGYDNAADEYVSIWMDSMSTWPTTARGKKGDDGAIELHGTRVDATGERPFRMTILYAGHDKTHIQMYDTLPTHGEVEVMRIESTRKTGPQQTKPKPKTPAQGAPARGS